MATEVVVTEQIVDVAVTEFSPQVDPSETVVTVDVFTSDTTVEVNQGGAIEAVLTPTAIKTANYSAQVGDLVRADTSAGGFTVTIATAVGFSGSQIGVALVAGTNALVIATTSGQTIGTLTPSNFNLLYPGETLYLVSDGSNWLLRD
jgi:hypothetical protein